MNVLTFSLPLRTFIATLCVAAVATQPQPRHVRVRREVRSLTPDAWARVLAAFEVMKFTPQAEGERIYGESFRNYDVLTLQHAYTGIHPKCDQGHFSAAFLPYHAIEMYEVEESIIAIDPLVESLPYWNYNLDLEYNNVEDSIIWSDAYFGEARGDPNNTWQIRTGPWAHWKVAHSATGFFEGPPRYDIAAGGMVSGLRSNPYGYLRGFTNMDSVPAITRAEKKCGEVQPQYNSISPLAWDECTGNNTYMGLIECLDYGNGSPHTFAHVWLGGNWGSVSDGMCTGKHFKRATADLVSGCLRCPASCDGLPIEECVCAVNQTACDLADSTGVCMRQGGLDGEAAYSPNAPCFHCGDACADGQLGATGSFWDTMTSVQDPVFMFHHPNMDRAFQEWQVRAVRDNVTTAPYFGFPESGFCPGHNLDDTVNQYWPFYGKTLGWTGALANKTLTNRDILEALGGGQVYTYDTLV